MFSYSSYSMLDYKVFVLGNKKFITFDLRHSCARRTNYFSPRFCYMPLIYHSVTYIMIPIYIKIGKNNVNADINSIVYDALANFLKNSVSITHSPVLPTPSFQPGQFNAARIGPAKNMK